MFEITFDDGGFVKVFCPPKAIFLHALILEDRRRKYYQNECRITRIDKEGGVQVDGR